MNRLLLKKLVRIRKKQQDRAAMTLRVAQHQAEENARHLDEARKNYISADPTTAVTGVEMVRRGDDILWHEARAAELNKAVHTAAELLQDAATAARRSEILFERADAEHIDRVNRAEQKLTDEVASRKKST